MRDWLKLRFGLSSGLSIFGALTSGIGAVWVFAQENQFVGTSALVVFIGILISTVGAFLSSGERTRFERELREGSDEIARLNKQIAASVTGGDSFCYLQLVSLGVTEPNSAVLTLVQKGEYPMYEVGGYMFDLQEAKRTPDNEQVVPWGAFHNIQGGNMSPNSAKPLMNWQLPDSDEQDYNVFLNARNGFFTQFIRLRRVDGSWKVASQVRKNRQDGEESSILYEQIADGFPLNEHGEVEWS